MAEIMFDAVPYVEAAALIRGKPAVSRAIFERMLPEVRARAFTISGVEDANVRQAVRDAIAEIPLGRPWVDAREDVIARLTPWLGEEESFKRAELLLRTHTFMAYQATRHEVMLAQMEALPYWQYISMDDEAVRDAHMRLHGLMLPANHPFWQDHYPPWDYGCRCQVVPVTQEDYDAVAGNTPGGAESEFGFALPPAAIDRMMLTGDMDRGDGHPVNVLSPYRRAVESGNAKEARSAWRWNPGDLRLPIERILERYDEPVRKQFETWAEKTAIPLDDLPGTVARPVTVMQWLRGEKLTEGGNAIAQPVAVRKGKAKTATVEDSVGVGDQAEPVLHSEVVRRLRDAGIEDVDVAKREIVPASAIRLIEDGVRWAQAKGILVPNWILLDSEWIQKAYPQRHRSVLAAYDPKPMRMFIQSQVWLPNLPSALRVSADKGRISVGISAYPIIHESAHHLQRMAGTLVTRSLSADLLPLAQRVSMRATEEVAEFVAEVYAGVKGGMQYSQEIMTVYEQMRGPR